MVEKMSKNQTTTSYDIDSKIKSKMSNIMNWVGFYREHIDVFIEDYLEIKVKLFQKIILINHGIQFQRDRKKMAKILGR